MTDVRRSAGVAPTHGVVYDISAGRKRPSAPLASPPDRSGISEAGRELSRALLAVEESPEVRAERVRALRAEIASGAYNPDPREIARHMLQSGF